MEIILIFLIGIAFGRYVLPILDIQIEKFSNKHTIDALSSQSLVNDMENNMSIRSQKVKNELLKLEYDAQCLHEKNNINTSIIGFDNGETEEDY